MVTVHVDGETVTIDTPTDATSILRAAGLDHADRYDLMLIDELDSGIVIPVNIAITPEAGTQYISARKSTTTS